MKERPVAGRAGSMPIRYRIVVRGELRAFLAGPLEGLPVRSGNGFWVITGGIIDQSQLLGILGWLGERGIEIVSLMPAEGPEETRAMGG